MQNAGSYRALSVDCTSSIGEMEMLKLNEICSLNRSKYKESGNTLMSGDTNRMQLYFSVVVRLI